MTRWELDHNWGEVRWESAGVYIQGGGDRLDPRESSSFVNPQVRAIDNHAPQAYHARIQGGAKGALPPPPPQNITPQIVRRGSRGGD